MSSESDTTGLDIVRGQMRPWTDREGQSVEAGGPVLEAFVGNLPLGSPTSVLILGPHSPSLVHAVMAAAGPQATGTVLIRSTTDAAEQKDELGDVTIVVGALDGLIGERGGSYDLVVALDGLDRVLSFDSRPLQWKQALTALRGLLAENGTLLLAHPLALAPQSVLDARPLPQRHGDDDWIPFWADATRPSSFDATSRSVTDTFDGSTVTAYLALGPHGVPRTLLAESAAAISAPTLTTLARASARATRRPLLADPDELIDTLVTARRYRDVADAIVVVAGPASIEGSPLITASSAGTLVVADPPTVASSFWQVRSRAAVEAHEWPDARAAAELVRDTAQPSESGRYVVEAPGPLAPSAETIEGAETNEPDVAEPMGSSVVSVDASVGPIQIPVGPSVAGEFLRRATFADVPAFRELAKTVGRYVESVPVSERHVVRLDDLVLTPDGVHAGFDALRWAETVPTGVAAAVAFHRLSDAMAAHHARHPWPGAVLGDELVAMWCEMAGSPSDADTVARGRALADSLAEVDPVRSPVPSYRAALADADQARRELAEARGHIYGLERTIGFRDSQLRTREELVRSMRAGGGNAAAVNVARISHVGRMVRRAAQVRSGGELTAGIERIRRRRQRAKNAASK